MYVPKRECVKTAYFPKTVEVNGSCLSRLTSSFPTMYLGASHNSESILGTLPGQGNGRRPCSIERGGSRVGAYRAFFEFRISRFEWPFTLSELIGGSVDQASSCRGMVYLSGSKRLLAVLLFMKVWDDLMPSNALLFAGLDIGTPVPERGKPESPKKGTLQSRHLGSRMLCCPDV